MNMLREALLLLRRSKGERSGTLQVRLFAFFTLFTLALIGVSFVLLTITGVFQSDEQRHRMWLDTEAGHLQNAVFEDYGKLSLQGIALAQTLAADIHTWTQERGIAEKEIAVHPEMMEDLLTEQADSLLDALGSNIGSGAFLILDAAANPSASNAEASRPGIFFKRTDTNNISPITAHIYCLRGPASVARDNGIELIGQWRMDFTISNMDFYERVLETARENRGADLSRLYYWSSRYLMEGDSDHSMMLCVPLIAEDGTVYGMCGMSVSAMMFKNHYTPDGTAYPRAFSALAPTTGDGFDAGAGFVAGNTYLTSRTVGLLTAANRRGDLKIWRSKNDSRYTGLSESLRLYPADSPYADETWALALLMPSEDWDSVASQSHTLFYVLPVTLFAVSLLLAVFINKRYIRPVVSALQSIKSDERDTLPRTQITEIDDLLEYLAGMDREHKEEKEILAAELEQARRREAMAQNASAYGRFLENLKTLTATERAVFNLYMENHTAQQIAEKLFIAQRTVKFHNKNIYSKLGVSSLKELMVYVNLMKEAKIF